MIIAKILTVRSKIMMIKPNRTILHGKVSAIRPEQDGRGAEIEIEVSENNSPVAEEDFLKTQPGDVTQLYFTEPEKLKVGDTIQARASLLGGPFGRRAVIEEVTKIKDVKS
jgi:hypothetical protein